MKMVMLAACLVSSVAAHATPAAKVKSKPPVKSAKRMPANDPTVLLLLDKNIDPAHARKLFPAAKVFTQEDSLRVQRRAVMMLDDQARFFTRCGLNKYITSWDQFEKDHFVRRLGYMDIKQLQFSYPKLPLESLKQAQEFSKKM